MPRIMNGYYWKTEVLLLVILTSCTGSNTFHVGNITMQEATIDTVVRLTDEANSPTCSLSLRLPYVTGTGSAKLNRALFQSNICPHEYLPDAETASVKAILDTISNKYISAYRKENQALYSNDRSNTDKYNQRLRISAMPHSYRANVLTYETTIVSKQGLHEEHTQTNVVNIDMKSGNVLTLNDFMIHGYENRLKELITKKLLKTFHCNDLEALAMQHGVLLNQEVYIPQNFIAGQNQFIIIYNQEEIAPRKIGEIRLSINGDELGKLFKN